MRMRMRMNFTRLFALVAVRLCAAAVTLAVSLWHSLVCTHAFAQRQNIRYKELSRRLLMRPGRKHCSRAENLICILTQRALASICVHINNI